MSISKHAMQATGAMTVSARDGTVIKESIVGRIVRWATSLRPYPTLALFAIPVILLEPVKPVSAYLIATGHVFAGVALFAGGEILKLTVVERLFHLNKEKLLSIPAFAWGYGRWQGMIDFLESTMVWRSSRRAANRVIGWVRTFGSVHIRMGS
jgi:hypothetical protein